MQTVSSLFAWQIPPFWIINTQFGEKLSGMEYIDLIKKRPPKRKSIRPDAMKKVYLREMNHTKISGWLFTNSNVFPIFMMLLQKHGLSDQTTEEVRFYDFRKSLA